MNIMNMLDIITLLMSLTIFVESRLRIPFLGPVSVNITLGGTDDSIFWVFWSSEWNKDWNDAKTWCKINKTGTLAILDSNGKRTAIKNFITKHNTNGLEFWVGLQYNKTLDQLKWVNGNLAILNQGLYQNTSHNKCYFVKNNVIKFFKKDCTKRINGLVCEVPSPTTSHPDKHLITSVTQTTQQTSAIALTDTSNAEGILTSTIRHVALKTSAVSSLVKATPTLSSSSTMDIKKTSTMQRSHPSSSSSSVKMRISSSVVEVTPTLSSLSSVNKYNKETSTIQPSNPSSSSSSVVEAIPTLSSLSSTMDIKETPTIQPSHLSSSSSSIVEATPTLSSLSSTMDNKETSTIQRSHPSSFSSTYKGTTSDINPTKTSLLQPSTTALPSTNDMVNHFHKVMEKLNASNPKCMSELLTEYEGLMQWINKEDEDIKYNPMTDAKDIEDIALEFTKQHLNPTRKNMSISNKEIAFHAMLIDSDSDSDVIFPEAGNDPDLNTIFLPKSLLKGQETYIVNVVYKNNKTISKLTPTVMEGQDDNKNWSVNTGIFSTTIFPKRKELFQNVIITLHHIQKTNYSNPHCSFWNFSIPTSYNGSWSQKGCEMVSSTNTHTVCACNHLTNFAVLMKLNSQEVSSEHKEALLIITYAGLALSLLGEAITVLLYCLFLNLRHEKIQIRVNFLCALATAQIIFLAGIDKIENKDLCTFIASLIHLFYLVCFCWMLMEGVFLYRMVVKVFDVHVKMRYAYVFAFGLPSGIVAITLVAASLQSEGIHSYISKRYCWIRFDNDFIWSFVTPVLMLIAINCFFLYRVLKEMVLMKSVKNIKSLELSSIRASARACVLLLPLLGITWLFGLLSVINTSSVNVAWQYIFTILNTMQGFMIFVFHCLRNTELQAAIKLRYFQWESTHSSTHSNRKSSTPAKFLNFDESGSRSNSLPMAAKVNQVRPEKLDMKYRDEGGAHAQYS